MGTLDRFKSVRVLVGVPSLFDLWHEKFAMSLCYMMTYWQQQPLGKFRNEEIMVESLRGSMLSNLRLDLVKRAIARKATHLLFVDTDQTFPRDTLHRLLAADKDVIACNIATKQIPAQPTARAFNPETSARGHGDKIYNQPGKGLQKVWRVGTGVMLIRMSVFDKVGMNVWEMPWQESQQKYMGEDWSFVIACEKAGIDVWIDHDLSEEVKHWGLYGYDHNVVGDTIMLPDGKKEYIPERIANG